MTGSLTRKDARKLITREERFVITTMETEVVTIRDALTGKFVWNERGRAPQSFLRNIKKRFSAPVQRGNAVQEINYHTNWNMRVYTPINIHRLKTEVCSHPDQEFVSYLLGGLSRGFHTGINSLPCHSIKCKNLKSAFLPSEGYKCKCMI